MMKMRFAFFLILLAALAAVSHADLALVERWPTGDGACADTPLRLTFDRPPVRGATGVVLGLDKEPLYARIRDLLNRFEAEARG